MRFCFFSRCPALFLFLLLAIAIASSTANASQLVRGPYLQQPSDTGIIVRWRTDTPSLGTLYYGDSPGAVEHRVQDPIASKEHVVSITGLAPGKRYYYSIHDTSGEIAGGSQYYFHTSPPPGQSVATRIWVLGDPGGQSGKVARRVRDGYLQQAADRKTDFLLLLGDNAYSSGLDQQYQVAVFDRFRPVLRNTPVWSAIGNHEANKPGKRKDSADSVFQTGPYYDIFSFPTAAEAGGVPSETEAYYSFDYGDVHIIVLDSYFSMDQRNQFDQRMMNWLKADLANNTAKWTIAAWHHSPYSKGSHDADHGSIETHMRTAILPLLEAGGVDLVLTGHSHAYERSYFLHGFYEKSKALAHHPEHLLDRGNGRAVGDLVIDGLAGSGVYKKGSSAKGTVYVVAGNASSVSSKGHLDHPAMAVSLREPGSLAIDINHESLSVSMINDAGEIRDRFSIVKNAATVQPGDSGTAIIQAATIPEPSTSAESATSGENAVLTTRIKKLERRIAAGKYDVEEQHHGAMRFDSSDLEMVNDKRDQVIALRFNKLNLPADAVIRNAWIQFEADEQNSRETTLYIHGEETAYSKKFSAKKWNLSHRNRTDSFVTWHPEPWLKKGRHGIAQRSPDITKVIEEILRKTDWQAGNAMTFLITGKGKRVARSFEGDPVAAPLLHIEYE
ncbi:MAG: metallophosphoesterase [Thiotrichales bacterium]